MEKLFELLQMQPALSIIFGALLTGFLMWLLKDQIVEYVKKRYNLYTEDEIKKSFNLTETELKKLEHDIS